MRRPPPALSADHAGAGSRAVFRVLTTARSYRITGGDISCREAAYRPPPKEALPPPFARPARQFRVLRIENGEPDHAAVFWIFFCQALFRKKLIFSILFCSKPCGKAPEMRLLNTQTLVLAPKCPRSDEVFDSLNRVLNILPLLGAAVFNTPLPRGGVVQIAQLRRKM